MSTPPIRSAAAVAAVAFCVSLIARTAGPFSDDNTVTHRVVESLILAALAVVLSAAVDFITSHSARRGLPDESREV